MDDGPLTWKNGRLVPLVEEPGESVAPAPHPEPQYYRPLTKEETKRFRNHQQEGDPILGVIVRHIIQMGSGFLGA